MFYFFVLGWSVDFHYDWFLWWHFYFLHHEHCWGRVHFMVVR